jgi:hypothetical protein
LETVQINGVYSVLDLITDLGGSFIFIFYFSSFLMAPISYHSFILKLSKRLFIAKTNDPSLFAAPGTKLYGDIF